MGSNKSNRTNHYYPPDGDDDFSHFTTATFTNGDNADYDDGGGPLIIRVIAPATLQEGYTFDVLVDDEPYTVHVPEGGVTEGEEFEVEYHPPSDKIDGTDNVNYQNRLSDMPEGQEEEESTLLERGNDTILNDDKYHEELKKTFSGDSTEKRNPGDEISNAVWFDDVTGAPVGGWRTNLCSCCDVLTQSTFWMGCFLTPVLMAQIITRLHLTWNGRSGASAEETSLSYNRIVLSLLLTTTILWKIPVIGGFSLLIFYLVVVVCIGGRVRSHMRQRYKIPVSCCTNHCSDRVWYQKLEDTCSMLFCGCCASIQMARHTHNDKDYPGHGCTTTGLGLDAPEIV